MREQARREYPDTHSAEWTHTLEFQWQHVHTPEVGQAAARGKERKGVSVKTTYIIFLTHTFSGIISAHGSF